MGLRVGACVIGALALVWTQAPGAQNPVEVENQLPGSPSWRAREATAPAVEAYSSVTSVGPGERIAFHVSTRPAASFRIDIYRIGWYGGARARRVGCLPDCAGGRLDGESRTVPAPSPPYDEVRASWPESVALIVPATWTSGYYVANVTLAGGPHSGSVDPVPFVVTEPAVRRAQVLVQVPVNTWQAYNGWGGKSLYPFNSIAGVRATAVSFDRPYFVGAGRQELTDWELATVWWLERSGYDVAYQTDVDTHRRPESLLEHRLVLVAGHGEYWTKEMRDGFEDARAHGTNLAFLGANAAYWQVRYANGERTIVSYKSLYDPEPNIVLKTALFREVGRPECALLGVQHQGGLQNWGRHDYVVTAAGAADSWAAGTGWSEGSRIRGVVSVERDTVPEYNQACANPVTVLFRHDAGRDTAGDAKSVRYTAPSGARVFSSGSMELAWGLTGAPTPGEGAPVEDPALKRFVANAMADLMRPAPASSLVARTQRRGRARVKLTIGGHYDPRVTWSVARRSGRAAAPLSDPRWRIVCTSTSPVCSDWTVRPGTYRYAVVARDAWASSEPVLTTPVVVRARPRR